MREGRLWRETSFDLGAKVWQVNWLYVLLLCALAGVGYVALFSAAGGAPEPYAARHVLRFAAGLVLMIGIALVDIRFIARLAWPSYLVVAGAAGAGDALRPCRQGRAALDRPGRPADPAVGADEDRAGAGAGVVVPPRVVGADRQSAVPDPAAASRCWCRSG